MKALEPSGRGSSLAAPDPAWLSSSALQCWGRGAEGRDIPVTCSASHTSETTFLFKSHRRIIADIIVETYRNQTLFVALKV